RHLELSIVAQIADAHAAEPVEQAMKCGRIGIRSRREIVRRARAGCEQIGYAESRDDVTRLRNPAAIDETQQLVDERRLIGRPARHTPSSRPVLSPNEVARTSNRLRMESSRLPVGTVRLAKLRCRSPLSLPPAPPTSTCGTS